MQIVFAPEAEDQIIELYSYIARKASPEIASRYIDGVISYCESLVLFPHRGLLRNDVLSGLRITHFKGRTVVAFAVQDDRVEIVGVFHGGTDYIRQLGPSATS